MKFVRSIAGLLMLAGGLFVSSANAVIITYSLSDKNPGGQSPPDYMLRLDNLFNTGADTYWTFSADQFDVWMDIDTVNNTAHIYGDLVGGIDDDRSAWIVGEPDAYIWELDFTFFAINITDPAAGFFTSSNIGFGTDATGVTGGTGTLTFSTANPDVDIDEDNDLTDLGDSIFLADYSPNADMVGNFAIGGPVPQTPYVSSWLADTTYFTNDLIRVLPLNRNGACCKDFGFRATRVPEPSSLMLLGAGLIGLGFLRRRRAT